VNITVLFYLFFQVVCYVIEGRKNFARARNIWMGEMSKQNKRFYLLCQKNTVEAAQCYYP
jgi:hypothetical protein